MGASKKDFGFSMYDGSNFTDTNRRRSSPSAFNKKHNSVVPLGSPLNDPSNETF